MYTRIVAAVVFLSIAFAQTPQEVEQRLSQLPPERRAYERFRFWISLQPPSVQQSPARMHQYRAYLRTAGFPADDIEQQIRTVEQQGRRLEVERWNAILTAEKPRFNTNPNAFVVEIARNRKPGTALDVGMGQGRNAVWLAQNGWTVTGFDPAEKAVALAMQNASKHGVKLAAEVKGTEEFDFGENKWDLIVLSYVTVRDISEKVRRALKPGGIIVVEAFHRDAARGRSIGSGVVFDSGELPALFRDLRVVRYEEPLSIGDFGQERVRLVRLCSEKPSE
jgi:SAM-dependent methyltransferase